MTHAVGTPEDLWEQSLRNAIAGRSNKASKLLQIARAVDTHNVIQPWKFALIEFYIYSYSKNEKSAVNAAATVCSYPEGCSMFRQLIPQSRELSPRLRQLADSVIREALPKTDTKRRRALPAIAFLFTLAALSVVAGYFFLLKDRTLNAAGNSLAEQSEVVTEPDRTSFSQTATPDYEMLQQLIGRVFVAFKVLQPDSSIGLVPIGLGTAFVVSEQGYLVTNRHVVEVDDSQRNKLVEILIELDPEYQVLDPAYYVLFDNEDAVSIDAEVISQSSTLDVAVIRVRQTFKHALVFGSEIRPGTIVWTAGYPGVADELVQAMNTVGTAINGQNISDRLAEGRGLPRSIEEWGFKQLNTLSMFRGSIGAVRNTELGLMIQTDSSIYHGMSGGPLLNAEGHVLGVNTLGAAAAESIGQSISWVSLSDVLGHVKGITWLGLESSKELRPATE